MSTIRFDSLCKRFGGRTVFDNLSFEVSAGERVALVGPNGVGKTTVLRILAGELEPDSGSVYVADAPSMAYLPQHLSFPDGATLRSELDSLPPEYPVQAGLKRFGLAKGDMNQAVASMSGGQKTRLALLKVWVATPAVLVLDEPTNHLDAAGLDWLESFVRGFRGTVLMVSHDRYFLDRVTHRIVELTSAGARSYTGNYSAYRAKKDEQRRHELLQWEAQQRRAATLETSIDQQRRWFHISHVAAGKDDFRRARAARLARRAKSTVRRLERLKESAIDRPKDDMTVNLAIQDVSKTGRRVLVAEGLGKSYSVPLFSNASFHAMRGDRIGLVGPNASGKTTLLRLILRQEEPSEGAIWVSEGARFGYMDQEMQTLRADATILGMALEATGRTDAATSIRARNLLGSFLFKDEDVHKPIGVLSLGERMRLCMVRLLLSDFNVLVLDEPTNHLDIATREKLEEALESFGGTLVMVSHDRYLLNRVCNKIFAIEDGTIRTYLGGYTHYLEERSRRGHEGREIASREERSSRRDESLLLQNRLAVLSADLGFMSKDDPQYGAREAEFFAVGRRIREVAPK